MKVLVVILKIIFFPITIVEWIVEKIKLNQMLDSLSVEKLDNINGRDFELIMSQVFLRCGFRVDTTPESKDYGADIILKKWGITIAVQCKLYYGHSVGNSAVYEVHAGKGYYNAQVSMVVTNSKYSKSAQILASKLNVILIDRKTLDKIIKGTKASNKAYFYQVINENMYHIPQN